jgi:ATP-dependent Clp protease ATP-binding subunit ClpC
MFERFTDRARQTLVLAQQEALGLRHNFIGTEHILLGLLAEGTGVAAVALASLGVGLERARELVVHTIGPSPGMGEGGKPPFTPRAKKVLELALREALGLGHNYIGTEHILLGILGEGEGVGAQVLIKEGHALSDVRAVVLSHVQDAASPPSPQSASTAGVAKLTRAAIQVAQSSSEPRRVLATHHYLLALVDDPTTMAGQALARLGVTKERVDSALATIDINATSEAPPPTPGSSMAAPLEFDLGSGVTVRIADRQLAESILTQQKDPATLAGQLRQYASGLRDLASEADPFGTARDPESEVEPTFGADTPETPPQEGASG